MYRSVAPRSEICQVGPTLDALARRLICRNGSSPWMRKRPRQTREVKEVPGRQVRMKKVCRAHQLGGCRFGDSCKFSHEDDKREGIKPAVRTAAAGQAGFGESTTCRYLDRVRWSTAEPSYTPLGCYSKGQDPEPCLTDA